VRGIFDSVWPVDFLEYVIDPCYMPMFEGLLGKIVFAGLLDGSVDCCSLGLCSKEKVSSGGVTIYIQNGTT